MAFLRCVICFILRPFIAPHVRYVLFLLSLNSSGPVLRAFQEHEALQYKVCNAQRYKDKAQECRRQMAPPLILLNWSRYRTLQL